MLKRSHCQPENRDDAQSCLSYGSRLTAADFSTGLAPTADEASNQRRPRGGTLRAVVRNGLAWIRPSQLGHRWAISCQTPPSSGGAWWRQPAADAENLMLLEDRNWFVLIGFHHFDLHV